MPSHAGVPADVVHDIASRGWRGRDTARLGGWLLRAAEGWTGRANSVLPLGDPGHGIDDAVAHVVRWYAARGLPARFQVPLPLCARLDDALERRGWTAYNPTQFLTHDIAAAVEGLARADLPAVELETSPSEAWLGAYHYRGDALPAIAREVMVDADRPVFGSVREGDTVVAIGRAAVDETWCGVTALEVDESHRRRGLAQHVLRALLAWGASRGAAHVYLQVADSNAPALGLYRRLGFVTHHRYHYRLQPGA